MHYCRLKIVISFVCRFNRLFGQKIQNWEFLALIETFVRVIKSMFCRQIMKIRNCSFMRFLKFQNMIAWLVRAQQHLDKNKLLTHTKKTLLTSSYLGFLTIWTLKLNIAFLFLSNDKIINICGRSLKGKFCFEREELTKKGPNFPTNHWLAFETLIRSCIDVSKAIEKNDNRDTGLFLGNISSLS